MKLLKLAILSLLVCLPFMIFSQVSLNVSAGGNMFKINAIDRLGYAVETSFKPGFEIGATADIPLGERVLFYPGIMFTSKGTKTKNASGVTTLSAYVVEAPMSFLYKANLGESNLLIGAGPYFSYGLGGNWKFSKSDQTDSTTYATSGKLQFLDDYAKSDMSGTVIPYGRPIDLGGNIILGFERSKFKILLDGQLGLLNLEPYDKGVRPVLSSQQTMGIKLQFVYKLLTIN